MSEHSSDDDGGPSRSGIVWFVVWALVTVVLGAAALVVSADGDDDRSLDAEAAPPRSATTATAPGSVPSSPLPEVQTGTILTVDDHQLIGLDGEPLLLKGVNRAGGEYACVQDFGIWDGPADADLVDAMAAWGINSVRIPLNEHCWLGLEPDNEFAGEAYRDAVVDFVALLEDRDLVAVLDLHWSGPARSAGERNMPMPNADHSVDFWVSMSRTFREAPLVVFDIFNEPHDTDWQCWRDGCVMDEGYTAVGMQALVDAVRSTGARQPIIVSGINYANDLGRWLEMAPTDPVDALMAGFHLYNFNLCDDRPCWEATVLPVAMEVPVITAELGEDTCGGTFIEGYLDWADDHDVSYLGWTFNPWDCRSGPALVSDHAGTPTPFGRAFRDHILGND